MPAPYQKVSRLFDARRPSMRRGWGQAKEHEAQTQKRRKQREESSIRKTQLAQLAKLQATSQYSQARQQLASVNMGNTQAATNLMGGLAAVAGGLKGIDAGVLADALANAGKGGGGGAGGRLGRAVMKSGIDPSLVLFKAPGHLAHMHLEVNQPSQRFVRFLRRLESLGFDVSEHPAFGGVGGGHSGRGHAERRAADINVYRGKLQPRGEGMTNKQEQRKLAKLKRLLALL